jgi:hypothetical protein
MDLEIEFNQSAFKHGVTKADIWWALKTRMYDKLMAGYDNKYEVIGFDIAGNPLEVMYNQIDEETVNVFHAMKCRRSLREKLGL